MCTCPESGHKMDPCGSCDHFFLYFNLLVFDFYFPEMALFS